MAVIINSIIQISGGAENITALENSSMQPYIDYANKANKCLALKRFGKLVGENIVNACEHTSTKWEFSKNNFPNDAIKFGYEELSKFLSSGFHLIAERENKTYASLEIRTPTDVIPGNKIGYQIEPTAPFYSIDELSVWSEINSGATLTARHIDLFSPSLGYIADELATLTGTSIFAKLFVSGGTKSTSGRHYDPYDVLIIMLEGKKHFRLEPPVGINTKGFDKIISSGDVLIIPTPWPHLVTPVGTTCIHVTFSMKQNQHWVKSNLVPNHLGYSNQFINDKKVIAGLVSPKLPPTYTKIISENSVIRTGFPCGAILLYQDEAKDIFKILAAGKIVSMNKLELNVLLCAHSLGCVDIKEICRNVSITISQGKEILTNLKEARLLGINEHNFYN